MDETFEFNSLLVPTDFSPMSRAAFEQAIKLANGDEPTVIVLHVIDSSLVDFADKHDLGPKDKIIQQMRAQAQKEMESYAPIAGSPVDVKTMITEGTPFLEIIEKARDLLVNAVVIGKVGTRGELEKLLFGSTAEKVIRGCPCPVIVLPVDDE
jgi:nucleotide-binding universal stress UspA family protein